MKTIKMMFIAMLFAASTTFAARIDTYELTMTLQVPRVYDNSASTGYRQFQRQKIVGYVQFVYDNANSYPSIMFPLAFNNKTHKMSNGKNVQYTIYLEDDVSVGGVIPRVNLIGDNALKQFNVATTVFKISAYPNYAISDNITEDNSLYLTLAGKGSLKKVSGISKVKSMNGYVAGQIGCSCSDYGHVSPTRILTWNGANLNAVDDVAAVFGTWKMKLVK